MFFNVFNLNFYLFITCVQLVSTCAGWRNAEKLVLTCLWIWAQLKSAQVIAGQCKWVAKRNANWMQVKNLHWLALRFRQKTDPWSADQLLTPSKKSFDLSIKLRNVFLRLAERSDKVHIVIWHSNMYSTAFGSPPFKVPVHHHIQISR